MSIGKRIKNLRKKYNISQVDLALTIDVSKQTMYKYENDIITNIPSDKIELMAEALFTTPSYLMGWTDDPRDWERIGNETGIHPPKDYNGSYEDYVIFKTNEDQNTAPEQLVIESCPKLASRELNHLKQYVQLTNQNMQLVNRYTEKLLSLQNMEDELAAAHERTDIKVTEEMRQHDDDIMNDENF